VCSPRAICLPDVSFLHFLVHAAAAARHKFCVAFRPPPPTHASADGHNNNSGSSSSSSSPSLTLKFFSPAREKFALPPSRSLPLHGLLVCMCVSVGHPLSLLSLTQANVHQTACMHDAPHNYKRARLQGSIFHVYFSSLSINTTTFFARSLSRVAFSLSLSSLSSPHSLSRRRRRHRWWEKVNAWKNSRCKNALAFFKFLHSLRLNSFSSLSRSLFSFFLSLSSTLLALIVFLSLSFQTTHTHTWCGQRSCV
jgi:hypothetical protein